MLSLFIAWRYFLDTKNEKTISTMIKVAFLSIFIGTFSLTLIISIMNGFEAVTCEKMQNIHPQIIIQSKNTNFLNLTQISKVLKNEFPEIDSFSPSDIQYGILDNAASLYDINHIIVIKGIDPKNEHYISNIPQKITFHLGKDKNLENLLDKNQVIIGEKLAKELQIEVGDAVNLLIPQKASSTKIDFEKHSILVSGLFNTGIDEFDSKVILSSINFLSYFFPESGITQIGIKLKPKKNEEEVISKLKKRLSLNVFSWKELDPALISALKLEKYVMAIIFILITLVAAMNIISLLFMIIAYKKKDLAILKSIGMDNKDLKTIFIVLGTFITTLGNICGLFFAYICGLLLEKYPFIKLPDAYYTTHLPIKMEFTIFFLVFLIVSLIGFLASLLPTRKISHINIVNLLKQEI